MAQAASQRGGTAAPSESALAAFFGTNQGTVLPMTMKLLDVLGAASLSDSATVTLQVLYGFMYEYPREAEDGWFVIWPSKEDLATNRGATPRTIYRHLEELEALGAIARDAEQRPIGGSGNIRLCPVPALLARLEDREDVRQALARRNPATDAQVTSISMAARGRHRPQTRWKGQDDKTQSRAYMSARDSYERIDARTAVPEAERQQLDHLLDQNRLTFTTPEEPEMSDALSRLRGVAATATAENAEAHAARLARKPTMQKGGPKLVKDAPRADTAPVLIRDMNELLDHGFQNVVHIAPTMDNLAKMKALVGRYGERDTRDLLALTCTSEGWAKVKAKWPKVTAYQPTPGFLLGWSESLMPWMKAGAPVVDVLAPKRSGGASLYERETVDEDGDRSF